MFRKFTGSAFAAALIAIMAMKHLALGFCLCNSEFFLSDCPCAGEPPQTEHVGHCCPCEEEETPEPQPCDDCTVPVSLNVGDFLWASDPFSPTEQAATKVALPTASFHDIVQPSTIVTLKHAIRGSPPPGPPPGLLRTTVLRL